MPVSRTTPNAARVGRKKKYLSLKERQAYLVAHPYVGAIDIDGKWVLCLECKQTVNGTSYPLHIQMDPRSKSGFDLTSWNRHCSDIHGWPKDQKMPNMKVAWCEADIDRFKADILPLIEMRVVQGRARATGRRQRSKSAKVPVEASNEDTGALMLLAQVATADML